MPPYRDHPYVRRYGHLSGPAVFAPVFIVGIVGFLIGALVMIPTAALNSRTLVAQGVPGQPISLEEPGKARGALVVLSSTPVAKDAATCQVHRVDGSLYRWGTKRTASRPVTLDGTTWYPVTALTNTRSGDSFTCAGAALGDLRAVRDRTIEFWVIAGLFVLGTLASVGMTALGFAMRRAVDRAPR